MRVRWNLNFIRECIKINKKRSKLNFWKKKFTIKMTRLLFVLCALRSVLFWSHLEAVLSCFRFRVVLKNFNELLYRAWGACGSMLQPSLPSNVVLLPNLKDSGFYRKIGARFGIESMRGMRVPNHPQDYGIERMR